MEQRSDRFARWGVELVIIVAGILIALSAEAWWADRQAASLEREYLEAFRTDVQRTLVEAEENFQNQDSTQQQMRELAALINSGAPLPDTILRVFPTVFILGESMDTYRDLVASGGSTLITSLEVRQAMSRLLTRVEYSHTAEAWALGLVTSMRAAIWATPQPVPRDRLADAWAIYLDAGERLLLGNLSVAAVADSALTAIELELADW